MTPANARLMTCCTPDPVGLRPQQISFYNKRAIRFGSVASMLHEQRQGLPGLRNDVLLDCAPAEILNVQRVEQAASGRGYVARAEWSNRYSAG